MIHHPLHNNDLFLQKLLYHLSINNFFNKISFIFYINLINKCILALLAIHFLNIVKEFYNEN